MKKSREGQPFKTLSVDCDLTNRFFNGYFRACVCMYVCTGGPLLTLFFKTLEKQPCKQKTVYNIHYSTY